MAERHALIDAGVSEREAEVLELVAERATNAEIAARLFVSVRTVESHVSSLLRKLDVPDRRALARLAHSFAPVARIDERPDGARSDGAAGRPDDATDPVLAPARSRSRSRRSWAGRPRSPVSSRQWRRTGW